MTRARTQSPRAKVLSVTPVVQRAADRASDALSLFVEESVHLSIQSVCRWPLARVPYLLGRPDTPVVAIYLGVTGDLRGHIVLFLQPQVARRLVERLLGAFDGWRPNDPIVASALGEVGNITVSSFLGALADLRRLDTRPTPPVVVEEQAGAILDGLLADVAVAHDDLLVIEVALVWGTTEAPGRLLVLPKASAADPLFGAVGDA